MSPAIAHAFTKLYTFLTANLPLAIRVELCDYVESIERFVNELATDNAAHVKHMAMQRDANAKLRNTLENVCHARSDIGYQLQEERRTVQHLRGCLAKGEDDRRKAANKLALAETELESAHEMQAGLVEELDTTSDEYQDMKHERDHYRAQLAQLRAALVDVQRDAQPGATVQVGPSTFSQLTYKQQCSK